MNDLLDLDFNLNDFCSKSDDELALLSKNNRNAAALIVSRFSKLIFIKSEIYANSNTDKEDLAQEGLMGLLKAVDSFDIGKGVKFSTYAEVCIVNSMKSLLYKERNTAASLENIDELSEINSVMDYETPESIYLYKEYFSELLKNINDVLSESEKKVFNLCICGLSYKKAAEKLGITEKSVDNAMQRARRKIRALYSSDAVNK